ncbi:MAG: hypothetical protein QOJ02_4115 [Acidobacteriota bacterium]|jgi:hypothetical protein|nr:hypothetical protein [Acidobacteriota bacterium]
MIYTMLWIWAAIATLWALAASILHFSIPLPIPDRGHRLYGVKDESARKVVVEMLQNVCHLKERFTFDSGPTHQTLMRDGLTVINYLDPEIQVTFNMAGTGLSIPVKDPQLAATKAVNFLRESGYAAELINNIDPDLPSNHLALIKSNAFDGWVLVFRLPLIKMPLPKKRPKLV